MAVAHESVVSWTLDKLSRAIAERVHLRLPTVVFDRRVVSDDFFSGEPHADGVAPGLGTTIDLADASRWLALIVPRPERLQDALESFARALAVWCAPLKTPADHRTPDFSRATGNPRITKFVKALYDDHDTPGSVVDSVGDETLRHWRSMLRDLGEGPRAVVDDPWFSHLFLSPNADESPLAQPYTRLDLRSPRVPCRAAQQVAVVIFDRLLERQHREVAAEVVCFILEGQDLEAVIRVHAAESTANTVSSTPTVRLVWINQVDAETEMPQDVSNAGEISPSSDDSDLYFLFSSTMDKRHRAAYVKGIMYGYPAFCVFEKADELPEDVVFLREAGMILGMSSPLVVLFGDC